MWQKENKYNKDYNDKTHERCSGTDILRILDSRETMRTVFPFAVIIHGIGGSLNSCIQELDSDEESSGKEKECPLQGAEGKRESQDKEEKVCCKKDGKIPLGL